MPLPGVPFDTAPFFVSLPPHPDAPPSPAPAGSTERTSIRDKG